MVSLVTVQPLERQEPQSPAKDGWQTDAKLSRTQFRPKRLRPMTPGEEVIPTRSAGSSVAWLRVSVHLPPSQARFAHALAISNQLKQMSRDELVALARKAEGCMQDTDEDAVTIVRRLRDEWDSNFQ